MWSMEHQGKEDRRFSHEWMGTFIDWVNASLSGWLVKWKEKCTEWKKIRMDGWMVDSIHECTKSEVFTGKKVFSSVCYNECKTFMVMFRTFSDLTFLNCFIELIPATQSSQDLSQHLLQYIVTNYFHALSTTYFSCTQYNILFMHSVQHTFHALSTTYFSTRDDAASSSDILNVSLHVAVLIYTFLLPTDVWQGVDEKPWWGH